MWEFRDEFLLKGGGGGECETQEKRFFFLNKRIGNYYRDGIDKNLDLSLDLG